MRRRSVSVGRCYAAFPARAKFVWLKPHATFASRRGSATFPTSNYQALIIPCSDQDEPMVLDMDGSVVSLLLRRLQPCAFPDRT